MLNMDTFNIAAGVISIVSLVFSAWIYFEARKKEAVEQERAVSLSRRLDDAVKLLTAVGSQGSLIATISERDETTKKELKHLAMALLATTDALRATLMDEAGSRSQWTFGVPSRYVDLQRTSNSAAVSGASENT